MSAISSNLILCSSCWPEALCLASQDGRGGGSGQSVVDPRKILDNARKNGAVSASEHNENRSKVHFLNVVMRAVTSEY